MRVLLVKVGRRSFSSPHDERHMVLSPPVGILQLASFLRGHGIEDVHALDLRTASSQAHELEVLRQALRDLQPDVLGLSVLTHEHTSGHAAACVARNETPAATIVMGGPHPSMYPRRVLRDRNIDHIVCGEGEHTLLELLEVLQQRRDPSAIQGLGGRMPRGEVYLNPDRPLIPDLDSLPMPAWDLYDPAPYQAHHERMSLAHDYLPYAALSTSRGCPYRCTYCHDLFGKKYRFRSAEKVLEEMAYLKERGIQSLEIYDDIFNLDADRMRTILEEMIRRKLSLNLSFPNGVRGDILTREDIKLLKRAGTVYLSIAVESASPRIQAQIKKHLDIPRVRDIIQASVAQGIFTNAFFMLGFPMETRAEMVQTIDFACSSPLHSAMFFTVVPHPATELGRETDQDELTAPIDDWNYNGGRATLADLSAEEVNALQQAAYRRFYLSPSRAFRVVRDLPSRKRLLYAARQVVGRFIPGLGRHRWATYE